MRTIRRSIMCRESEYRIIIETDDREIICNPAYISECDDFSEYLKEFIKNGILFTLKVRLADEQREIFGIEVYPE
jgi:repressor of nif and glnA expression